MTYTINSHTSMTLVDAGDMFTTDPMLTFARDGQDVPVSAVIPSIQAIEITEDPIADAYAAELTHTDGQVYVLSFPALDAIATVYPDGRPGSRRACPGSRRGRSSATGDK